MFAQGESDDVIRGEQVRKAAVVCQGGRDDANVSSELENVDFVA